MSEEKAVVTVVMPIRGNCAWLTAALTSVKNQSFENWRFVGYLDGPNSDAARIISGFGDKFSIIESETNVGAAEARNRVIRQASTEFIACLDYDDIWPHNHLDNLLGLFESAERLVLAGGSASWVDLNGRPTGKTWRAPARFLKFQLLFRNCFAHSSVVFRRDAAIQAGLYNSEMTRAYDHDLWLRMAQFGRLTNSRESRILYRTHPAQRSIIPLTQSFSQEILRSKKALAHSVGFPHWVASCAHWAWERRNLLKKRLERAVD